MRKLAACLILTLAMAQPSPALADASDPLQSGEYSVEVRLELPHLEDLNMSKTAMICVTPPDQGGSRGLAVLSDNNPLSRCPVSNVRQSGNALTFDIVCEGRNQASAAAAYVLATDSFRGRIAMRMGGKNMTMSEAQVGHRVGACPAAAPPS